MLVKQPYCLSIAGFDPCSGAGVSADIKVFDNLNTFGLGVTTALTYQDEETFSGLEWVDENIIKEQLWGLKSYPVRAVKIGLVKNTAQLILLLKWLADLFPEAFIVWDPVLKASAGFQIHDQLFNIDRIAGDIDLITPNYEEYLKLGRISPELTKCSILLKGGHRKKLKAVDTLITANGETEFGGEILEPEYDKHGTGCILSSAIAAHVANGLLLNSAIEQSKKYVFQFMGQNKSKLGIHSQINPINGNKVG